MRHGINRLPPLNGLRTFVVAARHLSFARAAAELNVTPAAVGQQIKQLEDRLGCRLFQRGSRALMLTETAQACLPGLVEGFDSIVGALADIDRAADTGPLTVSVAPSFAAKWLVPRLEDFRGHHPDIDVRVAASMTLADFDAEAIDCAIRYGAGSYPGLVVEKLLDESVVPVCSPSLLANGAALDAPADLTRHVLLHDDSPDRDPSCPDWRMWLRAAGIDAAGAGRGLRFNQSSLVLEAAIGGHGVALAKARLAAEDLRNGRLVAPLGLAETPLAFAYYFVHPPRRRGSGKLVAFRKWLFAQAALPA